MGVHSTLHHVHSSNDHTMCVHACYFVCNWLCFSTVKTCLSGIDGFSRLVTFLRCLNNNRADTALACFQDAVQIYGIPSRVRCDLGVKNVDIVRFMLVARGCGHNSVMSCVEVQHNQRIERLWRDVRRVVLHQYQNLFSYLETQSTWLLEWCDVHLFALHCFHTKSKSCSWWIHETIQ